PQAGRVQALAIDPSNSQIVYAGTLGGGVLKSTNGGAVWTTLNTGYTERSSIDFRPNDIPVIAIDHSNTSIIYAGTDGGIIKSTNAGERWIAIGIHHIATVDTLVIDPSNTRTIYAGDHETAGLFKSVDGGLNWSPLHNGLLGVHPVAIAIDPTKTSTLFIAADKAGVFKSTNAGDSWTATNSGIKEPSQFGGVRCIAIDPTNTSTIYVADYAGGVFESVNGGESWAAVSTLTRVRILAIDPSNTQIIYAATPVGLFKSESDGRIKIVTNGRTRFLNKGRTWKEVSTPLDEADIRAIAIGPASATMFVGTDTGGVFKRSSDGASWSAVNDGVNATVVHGITVDPSNASRIYAATWSGMFKSENSGATWTGINSGLPAQSAYRIAIDPSNTNVLYAALS